MALLRTPQRVLGVNSDRVSLHSFIPASPLLCDLLWDDACNPHGSYRRKAFAGGTWYLSCWLCLTPDLPRSSTSLGQSMIAENEAHEQFPKSIDLALFSSIEK